MAANCKSETTLMTYDDWCGALVRALWNEGLRWLWSGSLLWEVSAGAE